MRTRNLLLCLLVDAGALLAPAPMPGYVWAPGFWAWNGYQHVWVEGCWMAARPGYYWVPDRWERRGRNWHHVHGHWRGHGRHP